MLGGGADTLRVGAAASADGRKDSDEWNVRLPFAAYPVRAAAEPEPVGGPLSPRSESAAQPRPPAATRPRSSGLFRLIQAHSGSFRLIQAHSGSLKPPGRSSSARQTTRRCCGPAGPRSLRSTWPGLKGIAGQAPRAVRRRRRATSRWRHRQDPTQRARPQWSLPSFRAAPSQRRSRVAALAPAEPVDRPARPERYPDPDQKGGRPVEHCAAPSRPRGPPSPWYHGPPLPPRTPGQEYEEAAPRLLARLGPGQPARGLTRALHAAAAAAERPPAGPAESESVVGPPL